MTTLSRARMRPLARAVARYVLIGLTVACIIALAVFCALGVFLWFALTGQEGFD